MGKSSKTFYCHNTHLTEEKGWPTLDKKGAVVIHDWKNLQMFHIEFGKNPKVFVYPIDKFGNIIGECGLEETVEKLAKIKTDIAIKEFVNGFNDKSAKSKLKKTKVKKGFKSRYNDIDDLFSSPLPY